LWEEDARARAPIDQWIDWSGTTFQPEMIGLFWSYWRTPEKERNADQIRNFERRAERNLGQVHDDAAPSMLRCSYPKGLARVCRSEVVVK